MNILRAWSLLFALDDEAAYVFSYAWAAFVVLVRVSQDGIRTHQLT
jgi:hypothetical protein